MDVPVDVVLDAFGIEGTVTRPAPNDTPLTGVSIVWAGVLMEDTPSGVTAHRREAIKGLAVAREQVPVLPKGSVIEVAEIDGGPVKTWRVDAPDRSDAQWIHVIVTEVPSGG